MFNLPIVTDLMGCISSIEYIKSFESCEEEKTHKLSTDIATVETGSYEKKGCLIININYFHLVLSFTLCA